MTGSPSRPINASSGSKEAESLSEVTDRLSKAVIEVPLKEDLSSVPKADPPASSSTTETAESPVHASAVDIEESSSSHPTPERISWVSTSPSVPSGNFSQYDADSGGYYPENISPVSPPSGEGLSSYFEVFLKLSYIFFVVLLPDSPDGSLLKIEDLLMEDGLSQLEKFRKYIDSDLQLHR